MQQSIQYLRGGQINKAKWDQCIDGADNGLVYGYSFYLDHMAKHWDALVMGDYEAVMPLTWNKKWGIYYLYQPPFTATLGVFGKKITGDVCSRFIDAIPSKFKLIEIELNYGNLLAAAPGRSIMRNNYVLDLDKPYEELYKNYRENIRRNIKKSQQLNLRFEMDISFKEVVELSRMQMEKITNLTGTDYDNFHNLCLFLREKGKAVATGVYTGADELVASCVYFFSHQRVYYILVGNHPIGKTLGASHYLIDRYIQFRAGQKVLLDFEGSDIRNLAFFYSSFGAITEMYPSVRTNRLPWYIKWMK